VVPSDSRPSRRRSRSTSGRDRLPVGLHGLPSTARCASVRAGSTATP